MDPLILIATMVGLVMMAWLTAALRRTRGAPGAAAPAEPPAPSGVQKLTYLVEYCRGALDPAKLRHGSEHFTHYYIAYIHEVGRAVAREEGTAFTTAFRVPILLEAIRLCSDSRSTVDGPRLMTRVLSSPAGRQGALDGRADGAEAIDPSFTGPYWSRIHGYFQETSAVL